MSTQQCVYRNNPAFIFRVYLCGILDFNEHAVNGTVVVFPMDNIKQMFLLFNLLSCDLGNMLRKKMRRSGSFTHHGGESIQFAIIYFLLYTRGHCGYIQRLTERRGKGGLQGILLSDQAWPFTDGKQISVTIDCVSFDISIITVIWFAELD